MSKSFNAQDVIDEFLEGISSDATHREVLARGIHLLTIPYIPTIRSACWKKFAARLTSLAPNDRTGTVVALDLSGLFGAYFAIYELAAADKVLSKVRELRESTSPSSNDHFIVALDSPLSHRRDKYPAYKSTRDPKPVDLLELREKVAEDLRKEGFRTELRDGFEADDILASVATEAKCRQQAAVLITDDKDMWQSLGPGVTLYLPRSDEYRNTQWLHTHHNIIPKQVVDWLCLVGKDDVPTPHKIGAKTASEWLCKFGSVWDTYLARETLTPKQAATIEEYVKSDYWIAADLHTLRTDLHISWPTL